MPYEPKPVPLPSPLDYVPPDSYPVTVEDDDSFQTLAQRPGVILSPNDICFFNFRTRDPNQINWYLHHKVGCRKVTWDGKNYMFSSMDRNNEKATQPGTIHLPKVPAAVPAPEKGPPQPDVRLNAWVGLIAKGGTMFGIVGTETATGYAVSLDDWRKGMAVTVSTSRIGVGAGASGGLTILLITGVQVPSDLNGYMSGGGDFNFAPGPNFGKWIKGGISAAKFKPLVAVLEKIGAKTPKALKEALKIKPEMCGDLYKAGKTVMDTLGIDPGGAVNVVAFDVPFLSAGAEVSFFHGVSTYNAVWDSD
jgi:hypothetical protein